jgi:hypothetical protein
VLVYAIVPAPASPVALAGIGGERLRIVAAGRVAAVVGELRRAPSPTLRNMRRYAALVDSVSRRAPAIIPARFGTSMVDLAELADVLTDRHDDLLRRLRTVRGRVQMTLRMVPTRAGTIRDEPAAYGAGGSRRRVGRTSKLRGTRYLRRRAAAAADAREVPGFDEFRAVVKRWVRDERVEKRAGVATVYHLIPRGSARAYRGAIERIVTERGDVRVNVTGPYPPYAFASNW